MPALRAEFLCGVPFFSRLLEALGSQRDAVIVVGAQAVYLQVSDDVDAGPHTMDADLSFAPYTTNADLAVAPADLADAPLLEDLMRRADFILDEQQPGAWVASPWTGKP